jgi:hypothetical protein
MMKKSSITIAKLTTVAFILAYFAWLGRFIYIADRGYQSAQLTEIAKPLTDALNDSNVGSLECEKFGRVVFEIYDQLVDLPVDDDVGHCPFEDRLFIDKDRTVRITAAFGFHGISPQQLEDNLKSQRISDRREQFKHLAAQVRTKADEIIKKKAEWDAKERERVEEAHAAKATWNQA